MVIPFIHQLLEPTLQLLQGVTLADILLYAYFLFSLGMLVSIFNRRRQDIWGAIKGDDDKLDWKELLGLVWIFAFLYLLFGSSVFDMTVGKEMWQFLEIIFASIVIRDIGMVAFNKKDKKKEE